MRKHRVSVVREEWFSKENFERPDSIDEVESELRSNHDIDGLVEVEVTEQMSGAVRVEVAGLTTDVEGDP